MAISYSRNPVPILVDDFGHTLGSIQRALNIQSVKNATRQSWYRRMDLGSHFMSRLFNLTLIEWGNAVAEHRHREERQALWACYFPHTKPHLYHLMSFVHYMTDKQITQATGYTDVQRILRQPKLRRTQLQKLAPEAMALRDALASKKRKGGPDPLWRGLDLALTDLGRVYERGEIIED